MRLALRYLARFVAQTLAGFGAGALLEVPTWRALLLGLAANVVPAAVTWLDTYAATGALPDLPDEP